MNGRTIKAQPGKVYLVGAGPGDPELLTRKAASLLETTDVVLHDDLVPREILAMAGASALVANVGKRCGKKRVTQAVIHALMVDCARKGMSVVRLKSGDPIIFGRAGEEIQALKAAGIAFEIVPGIGAASAAAAAGGISLTDRRTASRVVFASGHSSEDRKKPGYWAGIASPDTTLVIYMPGPNLGQLAQELLEAGLPPATPCLAVSHASRAGECDRLAPLCEVGNLEHLKSPTILIVGAVAQTARDLAEAVVQEMGQPHAPEHAQSAREILFGASDSKAKH